jgi:osmotically-inducible protein OsmY
MNTNATVRAAAIVLAAFGLAACDRATTEQAQRDATDASRRVGNALERTGEKIADATRKATAEVKETAGEAKAKVESPETRASISDAAITASIKTDYLKDPDLSVLKIDVDTKDGVVVLNGTAQTEDGKKRAERIAGAIKGVKEVRNHLTVKQG